jgi:hypothetical protein
MQHYEQPLDLISKAKKDKDPVRLVRAHAYAHQQRPLSISLEEEKLWTELIEIIEHRLNHY